MVVEINDKLYTEISSYCSSNGIDDIPLFITNLIRNCRSVEVYGHVPDFVQQDTKDTESIKVLHNLLKETKTVVEQRDVKISEYENVIKGLQEKVVEAHVTESSLNQTIETLESRLKFETSKGDDMDKNELISSMQTRITSLNTTAHTFKEQIVSKDNEIDGLHAEIEQLKDRIHVLQMQQPKKPVPVVEQDEREVVKSDVDDGLVLVQYPKPPINRRRILK